MTTQETLTRRIRQRMLATGERYGAARRALPAPMPAAAASTWLAQPMQTTEVITASTDRDWDDWVALIEAGPGREAGHTAIAAWLRDEHAVDPWWAQAVTIGFERITGLRLPGQMKDGTFTVSRTRLLPADATDLRALLLDDADRAELLPGYELTLRSKPESKSLRFTFAQDAEPLGVVMFAFDPAPKQRIRLTVTHEKLDSIDLGEHWKEFWSEWLDGVEAELAA
ncbi:hypothetical protein QMG83_10980 [Salinibacterium sp. G-O1]|uniref:hypothetical protein n=1 Tax=Salinibacterium sp. G-O1 TaxID=3046208 RepID=UPI0024B9F5FC|nr:hypothetical protein [Salinibacterium sp. G-O1]MDJ0335748.1 hypothetical protein [Salinibacterium sp. G-O1]